MKTAETVISMPMQTREAVIEAERAAINEETRTVEISFSSEYPALQRYGEEILRHEPEAIDLGRLNNHAPLLWEHNRKDAAALIGVVERAWLDSPARKCRARVRFSRNSDVAERVFSEVKDGIIRNVSFGYHVHEAERDSEDARLYHATRWEPLELSFVSVPADPTVGYGRSDDQTQTYLTRIRTMTDTTTDKAPDKAPESRVEVRDGPAYEAELIETSKQRASKETHERMTQVALLAERQGVPDIIPDLIRENVSIGEAKRRIAQAAKNADQRRNDPIGLSSREVKQFSFLRAIRALANPRDVHAQQAAAFELECSRAAIENGEGDSDGIRVPVRDIHFPGPQGRVATRLLHERAAADGREHLRGLRVPAEVQAHYRDLTVGTTAGNLVATDLLAESFIDVLRNVMMMRQLGARVLDDLRGDVAVPRKTAGASFGWVGTEGNAVAEGSITFDQVTLTPHLVGGYVDYTRKLIKQSSLAVEQLVRDDFAMGMAITIDESALNGDGTLGEVTGIKSTSGINTSDFVGADPTWTETVDMEAQVEIDNALVGAMAYLVHPNGRKAMKTTPKESGYPEYIWENNQVNGYSAFSSNQVVSGDYWFANWADLLIGMWGGLDITVDPYTASSSGTVRVVGLQDVDVAVRHPESFCHGNITP